MSLVSISECRLFTQSTESLRLRYAEALDDPDTFRVLSEGFEFRVIVGLSSLELALSNIRFAAHELTRIAARSFRRPKEHSYEDLLFYHNAAALHEAGTFRNMLMRMLKLLEEHAAEGGKEALGTMRVVHEGVKGILSHVQDVRDAHVHEQPHVPPGLSWEPGSARKSARENKLAARTHALSWAQVADLYELAAELFLDLDTLLLEGNASDDVVSRTFQKADEAMRGFERKYPAA